MGLIFLNTNKMRKHFITAHVGAAAFLFSILLQCTAAMSDRTPFSHGFVRLARELNIEIEQFNVPKPAIVSQMPLPSAKHRRLNLAMNLAFLGVSSEIVIVVGSICALIALVSICVLVCQK